MAIFISLEIIENGEVIDSHDLSRSFYSQIICGRHIDYSVFLSKEEINIKTATGGGSLSELKKREKDPDKLRSVLVKIQKHIKQNSSNLPLIHSVYKEKGFEKSIGSVIINDIPVSIHGDLYYYDNYEKVREKIHLKSWNEYLGQVDYFLEVKPEIVIDGKIYFVKSITKAEYYEYAFEDCFNFLDIAVKMNKNILFEIRL